MAMPAGYPGFVPQQAYAATSGARAVPFAPQPGYAAGGGPGSASAVFSPRTVVAPWQLPAASQPFMCGQPLLASPGSGQVLRQISFGAPAAPGGSVTAVAPYSPALAVRTTSSASGADQRVLAPGSPQMVMASPVGSSAAAAVRLASSSPPQPVRLVSSSPPQPWFDAAAPAGVAVAAGAAAARGTLADQVGTPAAAPPASAAPASHAAVAAVSARLSARVRALSSSQQAHAPHVPAREQPSVDEHSKPPATSQLISRLWGAPESQVSARRALTPDETDGATEQPSPAVGERRASKESHQSARQSRHPSSPLSDDFWDRQFPLRHSVLSKEEATDADEAPAVRDASLGRGSAVHQPVAASGDRLAEGLAGGALQDGRASSTARRPPDGGDGAAAEVAGAQQEAEPELEPQPKPGSPGSVRSERSERSQRGLVRSMELQRQKLVAAVERENRWLKHVLSKEVEEALASAICEPELTREEVEWPAECERQRQRLTREISLKKREDFRLREKALQQRRDHEKRQGDARFRYQEQKEVIEEQIVAEKKEKIQRAAEVLSVLNTMRHHQAQEQVSMLEERKKQQIVEQARGLVEDQRRAAALLEEQQRLRVIGKELREGSSLAVERLKAELEKQRVTGRHSPESLRLLAEQLCRDAEERARLLLSPRAAVQRSPRAPKRPLTPGKVAQMSTTAADISMFVSPAAIHVPAVGSTAIAIPAGDQPREEAVAAASLSPRGQARRPPSPPDAARIAAARNTASDADWPLPRSVPPKGGAARGQTATPRGATPRREPLTPRKVGFGSSAACGRNLPTPMRAVNRGTR